MDDISLKVGLGQAVKVGLGQAVKVDGFDVVGVSEIIHPDGSGKKTYYCAGDKVIEKDLEKRPEKATKKNTISSIDLADEGK